VIGFAWWQWAVVGLCAALVGVAKTGVPGLGILVVPVLGLVIGDTVASAGYLLPLLCVADIFAVVYYRRHAQARKLWELAPWVLAGMVLAGGLLGLQQLAGRGYVPPAWLGALTPVLAAVRSGGAVAVNALVGTIVLAMIGLHLLRKRHADAPVPTDRGHAARYGVTAGFATTMANAAGPVMNLYLLSQRLPKAEFIATGAWFFLIINLAKLPIYIPYGMITMESLAFDACLAPAVVLGALTGRSIFDRIPQRLFERTVLTLAALAALLLFVPRSVWHGASAVAVPAPAR